MKFSAAIGLALSSLLAPAFAGPAPADNTGMFHYNNADRFDGPTMWIFGLDGLKIFDPKGSVRYLSTAADKICHTTEGYGGQGYGLSCAFFDVVSDGKKYVWAAVSRGIPKIDVFDINTGAIVGNFETCMTPRDLEYHPLRDEIWVRCTHPSEEDEFGGYMDVFSASAPTADTDNKVDLTGNATLPAYGYSVVDNTLGDVGYSTVIDDPNLYKIDLSTRKVMDKFEIPLANGFYEVTYSRKNRHMYARSKVCCTCGFPGADMGSSCGNYGSSMVKITTGPSAGLTIEGQCGRCDGIAGVDTVGVIEFDTDTDKVVTTHLMPDDTTGDPYASPDGRFVLMVGKNGGEVLRILRTGENGSASTVAWDMYLGFAQPDDDTVTFNDFAFIQTDLGNEDDGVKRDMIVVGSGTENKAAIIDLLTMVNGKPKVTIITLSTGQTLTSKKGKRQIQWIPGTKYVWIDGKVLDEVYVLDIDQRRIINTVNGIKTEKLVAVENYEHKRTVSLIASQITAAMSGTTSTGGNSGNNGDDGTSKSDDNDDGMKSSANSANNNGNKVDPIGITALIIGLCALIVGIANMVYMSRVKNAVDNSHMKDMQSVGSKNIA